MTFCRSLFMIALLLVAAAAFAPHASKHHVGRTPASAAPSFHVEHKCLQRTLLPETARRLPLGVQRQRRSVANVQTMGLFGLGLPEVAVVLVAVAFVVGPETLGKMLRGSGEKASEFKEELKKVPIEFQKGLEEGEVNAKSRTAKQMEKIPATESEESQEQQKANKS